MEKIRVVIADDHTLVRKSFVTLLEVEGEFDVVADAENGSELIRMLKVVTPPPDVCLLDISMPGMNGYETLVALKELYPDMKFLILTQLEHEFVIVKMLKAGASGYMLKTVEPSELKRAIRAIMELPFYNSKLVNGKLISLVRKGQEYNKFKLSPNEETFLKYCCSDLAYKEIAAKMRLPERTIAFYRQSLFEKLDVQSRTGLALYALKLGLVPMDEMGDVK